MALKVWSYARCGTCKKALKWLDAKGIEYTLLPIVEQPPTAGELKAIIAKSELPLKRFFNTSGVSYREGNFSEKRKTMSDDEAIAALAADGKLLKRPLIEGDDVALVGFKEAEYDAAFS